MQMYTFQATLQFVEIKLR